MHKCTRNSSIWTSWRMILRFCKTSIFRSKFSDDLSTSWYEPLTGKCNFGKVGRNFLRKSEDGDAVENCISRRRESVREVVGGIWKNELLIRKFWPENWFWFLGRNFLMKSSIVPMGHFRRKIQNCSYQVDFTSSEEFDRKINFGNLGRNSLRKSSILPILHFRRKIQNSSYQLDFTSSEEFDRKIDFDFWAEIFWSKVQFFLYFIFAGKSKIAPIKLISLPQKILTAKSILENWAEIFWGKVQFFLYFISAAKSKICKFQNFIIPSSLHFQFILHTFLFHLDHFQPHFVSTTTFQKSTHHAFSP